MKRPRWLRLLLLTSSIAALMIYRGAHSEIIIDGDGGPEHNPEEPPGVTMETASGAIIDYGAAEWGETGQIDVEIQRSASGTVQAITLRASDGSVLTSMTLEQAMAMGLSSISGSSLPGRMSMNSTQQVQSSGFDWSQPYTGLYGGTVTVAGTTTWR